MSVTVKQESGSGLVPAGTWQVDPAHSSIEFQVKHMMIATVKGRFTEFAGTLEAGEDGTLRADGTVKSASIDTHDETRNEHLRSADFFDAATYPELSFVTTEIAPTGGSGLRVAGELTIKGTTKPIELTGTVQGTGLDPWGNERVALELRGDRPARVRAHLEPGARDGRRARQRPRQDRAGAVGFQACRAAGVGVTFRRRSGATGTTPGRRESERA